MASRTTNPRGEGSRLRDEIVVAATRLLEESPASEVTLRAIARSAGIAAPSIYPHFADRDAIIEEVVQRTFATLDAHVQRAAARHGEPERRLEAILAAYVRFARRNPGLYGILFERTTGNVAADRREYSNGIRAFRLLPTTLRACVESGASSSTDPDADSAALWAAVHGLVLLERSTPGFPWPAQKTLLRRMLLGLAHLEQAD